MVLVLDVVELFFDSLTGVVDAQLQTGTRPTLEIKMTHGIRTLRRHSHDNLAIILKMGAP